jgi:hypothetical protein
MNWQEVFTIIGVLGTLMVFMINKLDNDIKSLGTRVDGLSNRLDGHASRIDQLYETFMKMQEETNKKFYDLLKDSKK